MNTNSSRVIARASLLGIYKLVRCESSVVTMLGSKPVPNPATHEMHLWSNVYWQCVLSANSKHEDGNSLRSEHKLPLEDPNLKFAPTLTLSKKFKDRYPQSQLVVYNDKLFHVVTWTDVLGKGHGRQSGFTRQRAKRLVVYLYERSHEDYLEIMETIKLQHITLLGL